EQMRALRFLPPPEYDRPYVKKLVVTQVQTEAEVRKLCLPMPFFYAFACNTVWPDQCEIVIVADELIPASGLSPDVVCRHEIAHCHGGGNDQKGARSRDDVTKEEKKLPAASPAEPKPPEEAAKCNSGEIDQNSGISTNYVIRALAKTSAYDKSDAAAQAADAAKEDSFNKPVLKEFLGRDPTEAELYLARNQGLGGAKAILRNPDAPAWQSVRPFYTDVFVQSKGYANGDAMAQAAIQTSASDRLKGNPVDQISGKAFSDDLAQKFQRPATKMPPATAASLHKRTPSLPD